MSLKWTNQMCGLDYPHCQPNQWGMEVAISKKGPAKSNASEDYPTQAMRPNADIHLSNQASKNDRNRIFVYGSDRKTRQTCRYLDGLNNSEQGNGGPNNDDQLVCLVTFFTRDQVQGGADADIERARVLPSSEAKRLDRPGASEGKPIKV